MVISDSEDEGSGALNQRAASGSPGGAPAEAADVSDSEDEGGAPKRRAASARPKKAPAKAEDGTAPDDDIVCDACGSGENGDSILLCDGCNAGWHLDCLEVGNHLHTTQSFCTVLSHLSLLGYACAQILPHLGSCKGIHKHMHGLHYRGPPDTELMWGRCHLHATNIMS